MDLLDKLPSLGYGMGSLDIEAIEFSQVFHSFHFLCLFAYVYYLCLFIYF